MGGVTYTDDGRRETLGALPSLLLVAATIAAIAGVSWLTMGGTPHQDVKAAAVEPVAVQVASLVPADAPAATFIRDTLGEQATWAAALPVPFGCRGPDFALSATSPREQGSLGLHVTRPGHGREALDVIASCGRATTVNGAPAVRMSFERGSAVIWQRGDVLISLASAEVPAEALAALDTEITASLAPVCATFDVVAADALRDPLHPEHVQWTQPLEVTIPASPADPGSPDQPALASVTVPTMPSGIAGPALPAEVPRPTAPVWPGEQESARAVQVPVADTTGPGCGWSFTGAHAPLSDARDLAAQTQALTAQTRTELLAAQLEWNGAVTQYQSQSTEFAAAAQSWNEYAGALQQVSTSWANQKRDLENYTRLQRSFDSAVAARDDLLERQRVAQETFDAAVAACLARPVAPPVPSPTPEPTATATTTPADPSATPSATTAPAPAPTANPAPEMQCPPQRPTVLDEPVPPAPVAPTPPVLWTPTS